MQNLRSVENGRLVYYRESADNPEFWAAHWAGIDIRKTLNAARKKYLGDYANVFLNHLPKDAPILEAGCGYGRYVLALQSHGYDVVGVEFSDETVQWARQSAPDLNITVGDILNLDYPDGYFGACISLGVVEHFREGPDCALREANRVIRPDGLMICSIPYFSPFRRWKIRRKRFAERTTEESFYQYAFTQNEFIEILKTHGFRCEKVYHHGLAKGLKDEIGWIEKFQKFHPVFSKCLWHLGRIRWLLPHYFAHMVTIVARKVE